MDYDGQDDSRKCYALAIAELRKRYLLNMKATDICAKAAELVGGERDRQHGNKAENFANIARHWNAYLEPRLSRPITPADVGYLMALLKIARTQSGAANPDDVLDAVGYLACAGELVNREQS